jgi:hypothetical protein
MCLRTSSLCLALALTGCGVQGEDKVADAAPDDRIECAVSGAKEFAQACAIDRSDPTALILRHADGGFRRIELAEDGTIEAADGSEVPEGKPLPDDRFELALGNDRYRLPERR